MKKIIWISSYPKSGNTWMRFLLANYFFNHKMEFDRKIIKYIDRLHFPDAISKRNKENKLDFNQIAKFWIPTQEKFKVENGQVAFLKNHNANISIGGNKYTNENFTIAIIYVVRDPRDVVVSGHNYFGSDYGKLINSICHDKFFTILDEKDKGNLEVISTWDTHFKSWTQTMPNIPKIIIRYEDLISNTEKVFKETIVFLSKILKFQIDDQKIKFSVENSKFEKLSKMEDEKGFKENLGSAQKFFRKGETNQYQNILTKGQIEIINQKFKNEMKYLKYL